MGVPGPGVDGELGTPGLPALVSGPPDAISAARFKGHRLFPFLSKLGSGIQFLLTSQNNCCQACCDLICIRSNIPDLKLSVWPVSWGLDPGGVVRCQKGF